MGVVLASSRNQLDESELQCFAKKLFGPQHAQHARSLARNERMPKYRPPPAPKPTIKHTVELHGEDFEVDIIVPFWAMHLVKGGEPHEEGRGDVGTSKG